MAFRHRIFKPLRFNPVPVQVEKQVSNFDENGEEHISFAFVSSDSIVNSMPKPSEFSILSQMQSGLLKPVPLDDFEVSHLDNSTASDIINSLNVSENENS